MTNLAITYFYQGKYREALILNMQSLELEKNVKGMVPIIIIIPITILNLILDLFKQLKGENHNDTILTMHNLANVYGKLGISL